MAKKGFLKEEIIEFVSETEMVVEEGKERQKRCREEGENESKGKY